jgi:hypothetical protein
VRARIQSFVTDNADFRTGRPWEQAAHCQTASQSAYPELYALIGGSVPDFRGIFLRAYDGRPGSKTKGLLELQGQAIAVDSVESVSGGIDVLISGQFRPGGVWVNDNEGQHTGFFTPSSGPVGPGNFFLGICNDGSANCTNNYTSTINAKSLLSG